MNICMLLFFTWKGVGLGRILTSCQLQRVTCKVSVVLKAGKSVSLLIASFYIHVMFDVLM